jgi:hypothetical protein
MQILINNIHKQLVKIFNNNKYCVGKLWLPIHNIVYNSIGCPVNMSRNISKKIKNNYQNNKITFIDAFKHYF